MFGMILLVAGLAFKISAVPFHMWTPDVFEGSPTPVTAFLSTAPKIAAMALFARVVYDAFYVLISDWQQVVALMSVLSMFVGAIAAIGQTNIKRLMAYSSIAHGLCYDWTCLRNVIRSPGNAGLHGDILSDEYWHFCIHNVDGKRWTACN